MRNKKPINLQFLVEVTKDLGRLIKSYLDEEGQDRKIPLYAIGGTALTLLEEKDLSKDIDFILNSGDVPKFEAARAILKRKYDIEIDYFKDGEVITYRFPKGFREDSIRLMGGIEGVEIYVPTLANIIVSKAIAGRRRDVGDVLDVLSRHPEITREALEKKLEGFDITITGDEEENRENFSYVMDVIFNYYKNMESPRTSSMHRAQPSSHSEPHL